MVPGAELVVPTAVLAELARLVAGGLAPAVPAVAFARRLRPVRSRARGDRAVLEAAARLGATVVTADRELARQLQDAGHAVLLPRSRWTLARRPARRPGRPPAGDARRRRANR